MHCALAVRVRPAAPAMQTGIEYTNGYTNKLICSIDHLCRFDLRLGCLLEEPVYCSHCKHFVRRLRVCNSQVAAYNGSRHVFNIAACILGDFPRGIGDGLTLSMTVSLPVAVTVCTLSCLSWSTHLYHICTHPRLSCAATHANSQGVPCEVVRSNVGTAADVVAQCRPTHCCRPQQHLVRTIEAPAALPQNCGGMSYAHVSSSEGGPMDGTKRPLRSLKANPSTPLAFDQQSAAKRCPARCRQSH